MAKGRAALALQRGGIDDKLKVELEARKRAQATPGAELTDAQLDQLALESGPRVDPTEDLNINLPTEDLQERMVGGYNVGPEGDLALAAPSTREQVGQAMRATSSLTPYAEEIQQTPMRTPEGQLIPPSIGTAEVVAAQDEEFSNQYTPPTIDYSFETGEALQSQFPAQGTNKSVFNNISNTGIRLQAALNRQGLPALQSNDPVAIEFQQEMIKAGVIDPESRQFTNTGGNALAVTLLEVFKGEQDIKDKLALNEQDPDSSSEIETAEDFFEGLGFDIDEEGAVPLSVKTEINPEYQRGQLANSLVNKLSPNPQQLPSGAMAGFGGVELSPRVRAFADTVLWSAIQDMGFIEPITIDNRKTYRMSQSGLTFYNSAREVLVDLNPGNVRKPSLSPQIEGVGLHHYLAQGFKKVGNAAIKSRRANDDSVQRKVLDTMGRMGNTLDKTTTNIMKVMINSIVNFSVAPNGKITLLAPSVGDPTRGFATFNGQMDNRLFSTLPAAKALGLDESKWMEHYTKALLRVDDETAKAEANAIMAMKARKLARNYVAAEEFQDKVFYFPVAYASSNERYMYRNIVLNPQDDKIVRNILRSPRKTIVDVSKTTLDSEIMQDFLYSLGEALLTTDDVLYYTGKRLAPKNMTMREITKVMQIAVTQEPKNDSPYTRWLRNGSRWKAMSQSNPKLIKFDNDMKAFDDPESWGDQVRAYIDFANYHTAKLNNKRIGAGNIRRQYPGAEISESKYYIPQADESPESERLTQLLEDAKLSGNPDAIQQAEQQIAAQLGLIRKPIEETASTRFEITVGAKADGRQSGMAIQAAQRRDIDLSKKVGIIFNDEENVIPEGDIRAKFNANFKAEAITGAAFVGQRELKKDFWGDEVIKLLDSQNDKSTLEKMLSRTPLMEHSYGKSAKFNYETVMKILNSTGFGQQVLELAKYSRIDGYAATPEDPNGYRGLVEDFNSLIRNALTTTLDNIDHQKVLQDVGIGWALLGGETPRFYGPLGNVVFIGGKERVGTGEMINVPLPDFPEGYPIELKKTRSSGSLRPARTSKQFDIETLKNVKRNPDPYGYQVRYQLPVLVIQAIDAAIMARSILEVNENKKEPKWGYFIHDAIVSDVRGIRDYRGAYNRNFKKIAINPNGMGHNAFQGVYEALQDGLRSHVKTLLSPEAPTSYTLNQSNEYKALHDQLAKLDAERAAGKGLNEFQARWYSIAKANGWKGSNSVVTKSQLAEIIKGYFASYAIASRLKGIAKLDKEVEDRYLSKIPKDISNM